MFVFSPIIVLITERREKHLHHSMLYVATPRRAQIMQETTRFNRVHNLKRFHHNIISPNIKNQCNVHIEFHAMHKIILCNLYIQQAQGLIYKHKKNTVQLCIQYKN